MEMQAAQDNNAMKMKEAIAVKRAVSKSSRLYKNSSWDLVDAVENEEVVVSELAIEDLPSELKDKSEQEIDIYIKEKKSERQTGGRVE